MSHASLRMIARVAAVVYTTSGPLRMALEMYLVEAALADASNTRAPSLRAVARACGVPATTLSRAVREVSRRLRSMDVGVEPPATEVAGGIEAGPVAAAPVPPGRRLTRA